MGKRKETEENWEREELAVPLPIQIFLWRQSSPFIRPKLGKLHEATCLFCQSTPSHHEIKEASKSLEKVLVQNILFGLSPSLTDAIRSVPRWRFVQAALPHVMHCAATLLYNRRDSTITNLGAAETKLLYTLHWILLDAAEECADADAEKNVQRNSPYYHLFSVTSIQVLIYLFAPLLNTLKESDFQNFRLENGLKIWSALWDYRHPDVPVFTTPVRPKRMVLRGQRMRRSNTQFGDVFLGSGIKPAPSPDDENVFVLYGYEGATTGSRGSKQSATSPHDPMGSVSSQDSRCLETGKLEEELRLIGGPREASFPETIPEETSSTEEEHVVIFRLGSYPDNDVYRESHVYKAEHPSSLLRPPTVEVSDVSGCTSTQIQSSSQPPSIAASTPTDSQSMRPGGTSPHKLGAMEAGGRVSPLNDPTLATIMDVAVMRCLFVYQWPEEGVYWALNFIYRRVQRMQEIGHEVSLKEEPRRRSNSLPVPKIKVSLHCDPGEIKSKDQEGSDPSSSEHNFASDSDNSLKRWTESETETSKTALSKDEVSEPLDVSGSVEGSSKPLQSLRSLALSKEMGKKSPDEEAIQRPRKLWIDLKVLTFTAFGYKKSSTALPCPTSTPVPAVLLPEPTSVLEDGALLSSEGGPKKEREQDLRGSTRKKKKISELKAFVETKLRSRSERQLEKIGREDSRRSSISEDQGAEGETLWRVNRPHSALEKLPETGTSSGPLSPFSLNQGLVKGKSMPSLSNLLDEQLRAGFVGATQEAPEPKIEQVAEHPIEVPTIGIVEPPKPMSGLGGVMSAAMAAKVKKPIITVTQHTPSPSEHGWKDQVGLSSVLATCAGHIPFMLSQAGSIDSHQYQYFALPTNQAIPMPKQPVHLEAEPKGPPKPPLARSHTDSNIQYPCEEAPDVPGTSHYVTRDGHINLRVLLKAVQSISHRETNICSIRVCDLILLLLDFLLEMGILKMSIKLSKMEKMKGEQDSESEDRKSDPFYHELKETNPVEAYMDTIMQIYSHLGCPNGCGEGCRGQPADNLRVTGQNLLSRIYRSDQNGFRQHLRTFVALQPLREVLDFFHAFLGFCVDPTSLLSPMSEWLARNQDTKRPGTGRAVDAQQGGYATNFGASLGGAGSRGIEGQVVAAVLKGLVTRFACSHATLKGPDNMAVYSDIRQLMCYVKDAHGGVFRRVALSGLIDSADRPHRKAQTTQTSRIVRRVTLTEDARDTPLASQEDTETGKSKKSFFRKKGTSSSITSAIKKAPSMSSVYDEQTEESSHGQSPVPTSRRRQQLMHTGRHGDADHLVPGANSRKKRVTKLVNWIRKTRSRRTEEVSGIGGMMFGRQPPDKAMIARRFSQQAHPPVRPRLITKPGAGPLSQKLLNARKKVEDHFIKIAFGKNKKRDTSEDENSDLSRRNSDDLETNLREASVLLLRERKLVDGTMVKAGMQRFAFLLETCQPGSIPDTQLAGAVIDLPGAPVVARAAILLEMAYFVHKCNRGAWPSWMKSSLPFYRASGPMARSASVGARRVPALQRAAGKMFYGWAEAIGNRLEELFEEVGPTREDIMLQVEDSDVKTALKTRDEEEDFFDELNVNPGGGDCPMSLRMIGVHLLMEITAFLRETYPLLPKSGRMSIRERPGGCHGTGNLGVRMGDHSRRWSTTLSSMGPVHASAQSLHSAGEGPMGGGERKISFALQEADAESVNSSNTTLTSMHIYEDDRRRFTQGGRGHFLKKSGGSFKRRSYKLKRPPKEVDSDSMKRSDSIRSSRRKVSAVSERSDTSEHQEHDVSGEESPGVLSNEDLAESPGEPEGGEEQIMNNFPWLRVITKLATAFNTKCTHQNSCHPYCYRRQMRSCRRLIHAVRKVYGEEFEEAESRTSHSGDQSRNQKKDKKLNRKTSETWHGSPIKRKDSMGKKDKMDKGVDLSTVLSRLGHQGSILHLSKDTLEGENEKEHVIKDDKKTRVQKKEDPPPILRFLKTQIISLFSTPFYLIIKSIAVISEDLIIDVLPMAWEMLLEYDNEVAATAAVIFILSGVRTPALANNIVNSQLTHSDPSIRLNAILRFQVIWRSRYQAWARMEDGGHMTFKVPPHGIEFTLPSPKVGVESISVVDPPWMPKVKTNVEEVTLDQLQDKRSFLTANRTRRKIHAEMVKTALEAEEAKRRTERENFLLSAVPVTIQAAYEPSLHHVASDEHEEGEENETETSGRPFSSHVSVAQQLFPSCLCSSVLTIIHLLDDPAVTPDGVAVYQTAEHVIWSCLVEDSALFLRFFLEKLTREKQDIMTRLLRRLIRFIPRLPSQAAFALFNYLVGYVMFYTRSPQEGSQEHTSAALSILWMVVPSVHGILFKDLKQIFRKEQCDASLLLTANIPSAKKIIVHGPGGADAGGIPSQFPIQEDTQFSQIHVESVDFFGIPEDEVKNYFLVDHKTNQIHNMHSYVRDFYFFKRSQYPQLTLVRMEPDEAFEALQKQAFLLKLTEIGKVLVAYSVLKRPEQVAQRVFFLHEELTKLPSFPRKALEADFNLYKGGSMDKEIRGLDQLHKYMWVQLIARMFEGMASNLNYATDLRIFISVINGALILHCEDSSMLQLCMATYINAATQFKNLFATNGYMLIMPTILRVYSNYQSNRMVCKAIEMSVKQLYILHRKPFVLQMLGSVAPLLDTDETAIYGDANKIRGSRLFDLLHSLERNHEDILHILDLVTCEKPLRALDFCYHEESDNLNLLEVTDMCVTVIAYAADSRRGHQMLVILEAILAKTLQHFQKSSRRDLRQEKETIHHVAVAIKTLIINSEPLAKNYNGPQLSGMGGEGWGSNRAPYTKASRTANAGVDPDDDSHSKYVSDPKKQPQIYQLEIEDPELLRLQFRQPRAMLLNIVAEFFHICTPRLAEINKKYGHETKQSDLLDTKCHLRLAEVGHSLLKMAPYDPTTMGCQGLQRYMNEILPSPDWSHDDLRPALVNILRRLEKMFSKLSKKSAVRRITDWRAASNLLKGVYTTLSKHPYIAHLPHLKMLVQVCQSLVLGERNMEQPELTDPSSVAAWSNAPPQEFTSVVVRIIAMQILALGMFTDVTGVTYSLEQICGGSSLFPNSEKTENLIVNLLLPMCLRVGCAAKDTPRMRQIDISFAVTVVLHAMNPPLAKLASTAVNPQTRSGQPAKSGQPARSGQTSDPRSQSWSHYHHESKVQAKVKPALLKIAFLGLKIMVVCFDKQLARDWYRILFCLKNMDSRSEGGLAMLDFLDFVVSYRTALFLQMKPFILNKLYRQGGSEMIQQFKNVIKQKLNGTTIPTPNCKGAILRILGHHLNILRDELLNVKVSGDESLRPPSLEIQSEVSNILRRGKTSTAGEGRAIQTPSHKPKECVPSTAATTSEPRLYRKTFLLRKRASSASLQQNIKGDSSGVSSPTPTSPLETGSAEDGSTASGEDGSNKHRLQRQMAQSRKTFRFRKSRHGQTDVRVPSASSEQTQQSISHIDIQPSLVHPVGTSPMTSPSGGEDSSIRQLKVPLIPEEEQITKTPSPSHLSPDGIDRNVVSDFGSAETSNVAGYRESLGGFDKGRKDLERLEMQVHSGYYQKPLTHYRPSRPDDQSSSIGETSSYPSPTSESSQTSRRSSSSSKRHVTIVQDIPITREGNVLKHLHPESQSQFVHPSGQVSFIPSLPYNRDVMEEQRATLSYSHEGESSYGRPISVIQSHPPRRDSRIIADKELLYRQDETVGESQVVGRQFHTFYESGPNFRHSWTEGEQMTHLQSYPRERGVASNRSARLPSRKTGIAGIRPPQMVSESVVQYPGARSIATSAVAGQIGPATGSAVRAINLTREDSAKDMRGTCEAVGVQYIREVPLSSQYFYERTNPPQYGGDGLKQRTHSSDSGSSQVSLTKAERAQLQTRIEEGELRSYGFRQPAFKGDRSKQQLIRDRETERQLPQEQQGQYSAEEVREHFSSEYPTVRSELPTPLIISGGGLPEGTKRFVVDKFTVTFTERDEEDTLI